MIPHDKMHQADSKSVTVMRNLRIVSVALALLIGGVAQANDESLYASALTSIGDGNYSLALEQLRRLQKEYPTSKKLAPAQTRIAVLQESSDAGESLPVFLDALTLRDVGRVDDALTALAVIAEKYPAGPLTDDALYISAYLQVMDRYDFSAARVTLQSLQQRFPDSAYSDSAQYLDAIAMEQLGDTQGARQVLIELRERHTALDLPLGFRWPTGTMLSRYWFDRADRRLAIVDQRIAKASQIDSQEDTDDGSLQLAVTVDGEELQLLLIPSPLTRSTQWLDAGLGDQSPPSIGVFDGQVVGVEDSWVRATLQDGSLTGVIHLNGKNKRLTPANMMGTLDYYQPNFRKPETVPGMHSDLADTVLGLDVLIAPPELDSGLSPRSISIKSDVRSVPISIVVDSQYDRYYAGAGMANALNNLNIADGIYRQFGLALALDEALLFEEDADPLSVGAVPLESILRSFRDYRLQYATLFGDSALSYLFSGNPKTDVTLGLAWIDTACRLDGYDVGVTTPSTFGDVLLTHELGHSFGAQHDTDTQCNDNSLSVMWPNISERTETTFSSCSQESVLGARIKSCLQNSVDLQIAAYASDTTVRFSVTNPDSSISLAAQLTVETSAPDQLDWPDVCQAQTPTSATCTLASIGPGVTYNVDLPVSASYQNSAAPVTGEVQPIDMLELQQSNNLATLSLSDGASSETLTPITELPQASLATEEPTTGEPGTGAASSAGTLRFPELGILALLGLIYSVRRQQLRY